MRILLADDSEDIRRLGRVVFERAGFEIETVKDGDGVLAAARANRPDLVILDIDMPNKDGFSALADLRGDPELNSIPVVVLTAMGGAVYEQTSAAMGVAEHLKKPFDAASLIEVAERVLKA